ncbi:MAG: 3-methyladenine glycosylase [Candidatus Saccharibacteria bacterium]|nr:3-methyladenine glycosylase [Candidatus Saccharibacteria bacterium]
MASSTQELLSDSFTAARNLLGMKLVHETPEGITSGYIVETEAYDMSDPASHTYGGETPRNAAMFKEAGTIYVYFIYGIHYCFNIVTGESGHGQAVLIRALEPIEGIELMQKRRGVDDVVSLTNGPAKLVSAMGITKDDMGKSVFTSNVRIERGFSPSEVVQTTRVGITKAADKPWRFYIADNRFVSKR